MKATAVEVQAAFPPGTPLGVPMPASSSLTLATGAVILTGLTTKVILAGPMQKEQLQQLLLVAGPASVLTAYPSFPPQGVNSQAGGLLIQVISTTAIALQGSIAGLVAYTLGQAGDYAEGQVHRRIRRKIATLLGDGAQYERGTELSFTQGDTISVWGKVASGSLTVDRKRWGPPALEALGVGSVVKPGDTVIAGAATVVVEQSARLEAVDLDPTALQTNGITALRPGHNANRMRRQFFYWASTVAGLTLLLTGNIHQALGVMLAGAPAFLDVVGGATSWQESAKWEKRGVLPAHPLGLVAAAEVDTVLFDEPEAPGPNRLVELREAASTLRQHTYQIGLLTGAAPVDAAAAAEAIGADLWFSGTPEERALWVADLFRERLVVVVGSGRESVPAMATAHLAVAGLPKAPVVAAAHVTLTSSLRELPAFLADSREAGRAEQHGATIAKSLMVAATVAAGVGLLAATSVVTFTSLLGLGLVGLKGFLGGGKRGRPTAANRLS